MLSPSDIYNFLRFTKANGVLVARGAIHNPRIFSLKKQILNGEIIEFNETLNQIWLENTDEEKSLETIEVINKIKQVGTV
jgi:tRNA-dihydrouridine synthase